MRKEVLYSLKGIYRENFEIEGYRFGNGEKSAMKCSSYIYAHSL